MQQNPSAMNKSNKEFYRISGNMMGEQAYVPNEAELSKLWDTHQSLIVN